MKTNTTEYELSDWKYEVANNDTRLGFKEWLEHKVEVDTTNYRDTRGTDRVYGGEEPPFEVNDEFARTGRAEDY